MRDCPILLWKAMIGSRLGTLYICLDHICFSSSVFGFRKTTEIWRFDDIECIEKPKTKLTASTSITIYFYNHPDPIVVSVVSERNKLLDLIQILHQMHPGVQRKNEIKSQTSPSVIQGKESLNFLPSFVIRADDGDRSSESGSDDGFQNPIQSRARWSENDDPESFSSDKKESDSHDSDENEDVVQKTQEVETKKLKMFYVKEQRARTVMMSFSKNFQSDYTQYSFSILFSAIACQILISEIYIIFV